MCRCSESFTSTGAGNVKKGQKKQQGVLSMQQALGSIPAHPFPEIKKEAEWFLRMWVAYSYRDGKRINEFCEENPETVKETHLKDKRKMTLSLL